MSHSSTLDGAQLCVILLPIAVTFYITWWVIKFFDGFFSPIYDFLGIHFFGLRFVTTFLFIFLVGVFVSLWIGVSMLLIGEWFIRRMPLVKHIYSASKQISDAISPGVAFACPGTMLGSGCVKFLYASMCFTRIVL
ncbi:hypothetical protein CY35_08G066800 [Sphagnum magellanicum]|nr:hypothetical protein CY35_08G066800 [Sphagnum magellanicum]